MLFKLNFINEEIIHWEKIELNNDNFDRDLNDNINEMNNKKKRSLEFKIKN